MLEKYQRGGEERAHGVVAGAGGRAVRGPQRRLGPKAHHEALAAVAQQVADLGPCPLAVSGCGTAGTSEQDVSIHLEDINSSMLALCLLLRLCNMCCIRAK